MSKKTEEENLQPKIPRPAISTLPFEWLKIDIDTMEIIPGIEKIPQGYEGGDRYWYLVKVHYRIGSDGKRQYLLNFDDLGDCLRVRDDPNCPGFECVSKRWIYGFPVKLTNE